MPRILIVEDEPLIAEDLSFLIKDIGHYEVEITLTYEDAVSVLQHQSFDIALLDINLSCDKDGIDLAHLIREKYQFPFIFITSYYNSSVVARAKVTEPLAYLLKPFNKHDVSINVEMALYKSKIHEATEVIFVKDQNGSHSLHHHQIVYLEADDNYTRIKLEEDEVIVSQTLKSIHKKLPSNVFVRVHKSYCVCLPKITMIKGGFVYLGDHRVPIGRSYKEDFMKQISTL